MRRTIPFVVAVVATVVAVLGVMGGVGIGLPTTGHGGTPTDVYTLEEPTPEGCAPIGVNTDGVSIMPLQVEVDVPSIVLAYFSYDWFDLHSWEGGQVSPRLDQVDMGPGSRQSTVMGNPSGYWIGGTTTAAFLDVEPGTHLVDVYAGVHQLSVKGNREFLANLQDCLLTVFVVPTA